MRRKEKELLSEVQRLHDELKRADVRADELAYKLAAERNRVLLLKFQDAMGPTELDTGSRAGPLQRMSLSGKGSGEADVAALRNERQQFKRLLAFIKQKLAADLEVWRADGRGTMSAGVLPKEKTKLRVAAPDGLSAAESRTPLNHASLLSGTQVQARRPGREHHESAGPGEDTRAADSGADARGERARCRHSARADEATGSHGAE